MDIMVNSTTLVGLAQSNASSKSQQWSFDGTKIRNEANNLFMQGKPFWGLSLKPGAGLVVGALESDSHADFTLMDSSVLRSYVPQLEADHGPNFEQNGDFAKNWNETLKQLVQGEMTDICNWTILQDIGWNNNLSKDGFDGTCS